MAEIGTDRKWKSWIRSARQMAGGAFGPGRAVRVVRPGRPTDLRLHKNFRSRFLPARRHLAVYLPPGYHSSQQRYPILYMKDGQNLFDPSTSFIPGMDWRVDETAERLISSGEIGPLIIVGIYNAGQHRTSEYTPWPNGELGGGKADLHARMLVEEIMPFINQRYRTLDGPLNTGLGGSSLGGLAALYMGLCNSEHFGKLAVLSPSVWWKDRAILEYIAGLSISYRPRIWLDIGTDEGGNSLEDARLLRAALLKKGWREGEDLHYLEINGGKHDEAAWSARVGPFLQFLFSSPVIAHAEKKVV